MRDGIQSHTEWESCVATKILVKKREKKERSKETKESKLEKVRIELKERRVEKEVGTNGSKKRGGG